MKRRLIGIFLCIFYIITLQIFNPGQIVSAEGELTVSTKVTGMVREFSNLPFVSPMGIYAVEYKIKNTSQAEIEIIELLEQGPGDSEPVPVKITGRTRLEPGEQLIQTGNTYSGEPGSTPNVVRYTLVYTINQEEQVDDFVEGYTYVHVINVDFRAAYTSQTQSPVFKGEQVDLQVELESLANVTLYNLTVIDSDLEEEIGKIDVLAPGAKAEVKKTLSIQKSTLGNLLILYSDPMDIMDSPLQHRVKTNLELNVRDEEPVSSLELTGKTDKSKIPGETSVEFQLTAKNTGNTTLNDLKFLDWAGNEFHTHDSLKPGDEVTASYKGSIRPDADYDLMVQARVENSNQLIKNTWTARLEKLVPQVEIERSVSGSIKAGEPFTLEYVVRNTGNVDLLDVKIEESAFGEITGLDLIPAGGEAEFSKELVLEESAYSTALLKARDAETDKEYIYETSEMEFVVGESSDEEESPEQMLSIILKADKDSLSRPGTVEMECIVKNIGSEPLYNLIFTLMDRDMIIDSMSALEPGEEKVIAIPSIRIEETETFVVEATGLGPNQQKFTVKSQPLTIEIAAGGLSGKFSVLRVVLIIVILLCVLVIGVLVYTLRDSFRLPFRRKKQTSREK